MSTSTEPTPVELRLAAAKTADPEFRRRLLVVAEVFEGRSPEIVAKAHDMGVLMVEKWSTIVVRGGVDLLRSSYPEFPGLQDEPPPYRTDEELAAGAANQNRHHAGHWRRG